ncbi:WXG100 family type VII secretion target [Amycolatopsis pittospori]|uniref:WXG100 family type VII secretion target n=1 Tax=Amycolatopsis pittospori TaxID=2749434 RepID=UPI0015F019A9|nr:WXG100 family type VII secretion target [Amycolatopsis pittospori]
MSELAEYPIAADQKIRDFAGLPLIGRSDVFLMLDDIRTRLLGNAVSVQEIASRFASNATIQDAHDDIGAAVQALAGTWTGRAADQFVAHAANVTNALKSEQEAVASVSAVMTDIAHKVIETYASAITLLGECAGELAKIDLKALVAALTSVIPGVNLITFADVIDSVIEALGELVKKVVALFADAIKAIDGFKGSAVGLTQIKTNFVELPELRPGSGVEDQKQWKVEPDAFPE